MNPCPLCGCRPCHCDPVPSPAPKESGGVGATLSAEAVEAFLLTPKPGATPAELLASPLVGMIKSGEQPAGWAEMLEELGCEPVEPHPLESRRDALVARLLAAGFVEQERGVDLRRFEGAGWSVPTPIDLTASDAAKMLDKADAVCELVAAKTRQATAPFGRDYWTPLPEGLAGLGARGQEPSAPGPTLADLRAELVRRDVLLAQMEADRDYERRRANEAIAQLHDAQREMKAITAALDADPERSPAWDGDDQLVPPARRVEVALMPEGPGKTWIERKIKSHLDDYGVPTERSGLTLTLASRVAVAAEGWRDHSALQWRVTDKEAPDPGAEVLGWYGDGYSIVSRSVAKPSRWIAQDAATTDEPELWMPLPVVADHSPEGGEKVNG